MINIKKIKNNYRSILWYETNKLNDYIIKNGSEKGFKYKYLNMSLDDYIRLKLTKDYYIKLI